MMIQRQNLPSPIGQINQGVEVSDQNKFSYCAQGGIAVEVTPMCTAEKILLPLQRLQLAHDEAAHKDILGFDLYTRLKHMVLHFFKYAGNVENARESKNEAELRRVLLDAFIICLASANALNLSLGKAINISRNISSIDQLAREIAEDRTHKDVFAEAVKSLVLVGGKMAKVMESTDHMEEGDPRKAMKILVPQLTIDVLRFLGSLDFPIEASFKARLKNVEQKSIFLSHPIEG